MSLSVYSASFVMNQGVGLLRIYLNSPFFCFPATSIMSVAELTTKVAEAKKAYKANKADKSLKAKYKEAKAAAEKAEAEQAGAGAAAAEAPKEEKNEEVDMLSNLKKNKPAAAVTSESGKAATEKLFCGNLSWDIDDDGIKEFFKEFGELTDVHWLTDRDSGKFKGCGFVTFTSVENASNALQSKNGVELLGRPIKLDFATPRPGGNAGGAKKKFGQDRPMSEKPEGCTTVFAGNLSFQIDDDQMHEFAKDSGDIKSIRWLTDRDSGDFKGCGFIEFYKTEAVDEFVKLNGKDLLGRAIRLDYAKARAPKPEW